MGTKDKGPEAFRGVHAERQLLALILAEMRALVASSTQFMARLGSGVVNDVLAVETVIFDAAASRSWEFQVAAGSIEVNNLSETEEIVVHAASLGARPDRGVGVYVVPASTTRVVSLASRTVTLYGVAAERCSVQVFTRGAGASSAGIGTVFGGAP
jgi:hypothetical protein